jgi:integrase
MHEDLVDNDHRRIAGEVDELLQAHKLLSLDHESDAFKVLCRELFKAKRDVFSIEIDRWKGDYSTSTGNGAASAGHHGSSEGEPAEVLSLTEAVPLYLKHYEHRAPGTIKAKRTVLKRFADLVGNKPVHSITKAECVAYRDALLKLPTNMSKRFPGKSCREVLALLNDGKASNGITLLSRNTVNQDIMHLSHFFGWLIDEGKRTKAAGNPVEGISFDGIEAKSHEEYTDEELAAIFTSEDYTRQSFEQQDYARYFIPLILLYSGCRREEVAHLALVDIKQEASMWFMDVAPDPERGRRLK